MTATDKLALHIAEALSTLISPASGSCCSCSNSESSCPRQRRRWNQLLRERTRINQNKTIPCSVLDSCTDQPEDLIGQAHFTHSHTGSESITTPGTSHGAQFRSQSGYLSEASGLVNQENKPAEFYSTTMNSAVGNGGNLEKPKMMVAATDSESKTTCCGYSRQDHFTSSKENKSEIIDEGSGDAIGYSMTIPFAESSGVAKTCGPAGEAISIEAHYRRNHGSNDGTNSDVPARPAICAKLVEDGGNTTNSDLTAANLRRKGNGGTSDHDGEAAAKVSPIEIIGQVISS
jgi:hypothetical protein